MATCDMGYEHAEPVAEPDPAPVVVESGPNENDVRIAEIEAAASIEREKIWTDQQALDLVAQVERQAGEIKGMREILDRLAPPEPEPAEVVPPVPAVIPEPAGDAPDETPPPPDVDKKAPKKSGGFWDGYAKA